MSHVFSGRPAGARPADQLLWDALELLIPIADLNYKRVLAAALEFGTAADSADATAEGESRVILLADVTAFIGTLDRLRRLVAKMGGGPDLRVAKAAFLVTVGDYEDARHHLEHLDSAVARLAQEPVAALAMVTWWETPEPTHLIGRVMVPGIIRVGMSPSLQVPTSMRDRIDHVTAFIAGDPFDLSRAHDAVRALWERLRNWSEQYASTDELA